MSRQNYGWKPSLPDQRDQVADAEASVKVLAEVDPRKAMPDPYDQSTIGSCTANAVARACQYHFSLDNLVNNDWVPSRLDIYYGERMEEGSPANQDTGAFGRDGFKWAYKTGVFDETHWPYDVSKFAIRPPQGLTRTKISAYKAVPRRLNSFKAVLSNRQTIAFGFTVYESFESDEVARTGIVPVPKPTERVRGGHEVLAIGYLQSHPDHVLCANSWGVDWGMGGHFLMPWHILLNSGMSSDFRTIYRPQGA